MGQLTSPGSDPDIGCRLIPRDYVIFYILHPLPFVFPFPVLFRPDPFTLPAVDTVSLSRLLRRSYGLHGFFFFCRRFRLTTAEKFRQRYFLLPSNPKSVYVTCWSDEGRRRRRRRLSREEFFQPPRVSANPILNGRCSGGYRCIFFFTVTAPPFPPARHYHRGLRTT